MPASVRRWRFISSSLPYLRQSDFLRFSVPSAFIDDFQRGLIISRLALHARAAAEYAGGQRFSFGRDFPSFLGRGDGRGMLCVLILI